MITKYLFIIVAGFLFSISNSENFQEKLQKKIKISGKITRTQSYCKGIAPTPEEEREYKREKPYAGKVLYIKSGKINTGKQDVLAEVVTDSKGEFVIFLPPGEYCFIQKEQLNKKILETWNTKGNNLSDSDCLKNWWASCIKKITVFENDITDITFHFHKPCFLPENVPCIRYNGPVPP